MKVGRRIKPDLKNLDLNDWLFPCQKITQPRGFQDRQVSLVESAVSALSNYNATQILRTFLFLKCVALSETLMLPRDLVVDYSRYTNWTENVIGLATNFDYIGPW